MCVALLNKNTNLNKNKRNQKWKIPRILLERRILGFGSCKNRHLTVMSWNSRKKKSENILYRLFCPKEIILTFVFYLNV